MLIDAWPVAALFVFCIACVLGAHFYTVRQEKRKKAQSPAAEPRETLYESTSAEEKARVESLLPTVASEDVSQLVSVPMCERQARVIDGIYEADLSDPADWVIDIEFNTPMTVPETAAIDLFNKQRPMAFAYGIEARTGLWTCCAHHDGQVLHMKQLALKVPIFSTVSGYKEPTAEDLNDILKTMTDRARSLGEVTLKPRISPEEAADRARKLSEFHAAEVDGFNEVEVVLQAIDDYVFSGRQVWDVMLCLGLEWGDMDLFHLPNETGAGDQELFSVATTTEPEYFLPESIAAGQEYVDLVFMMSIARTHNPAAVFDAMMNAVRYAQQRLGGEILDGYGDKLDEAALRARIDERARQLADAGCPAGSHTALVMF